MSCMITSGMVELAATINRLAAVTRPPIPNRVTR